MFSLPRQSLWLLPFFFALASCLFDADDEDPKLVLDSQHATAIPISHRFTLIQLDPTTPNRFLFVAREGESYRIETSHKLAIALFDKAGAQLPVHSNPAHEGLAVETAPLPAGTHYVVLNQIDIDYCTPYWCVANLRIVPIVGGIPVDSFESDNQISQAKDLVPKLFNSGYWSHRGQRTLHPSDTDWVKFQADSGWLYSIRASGVPFRIELVGPGSILLDTVSAPDAFEGTVIDLRCRRGGPHYLRIVAIGPTTWGGIDSGGYFLDIVKEKIDPREDWVRDSDNTVDSATTLATGGEWRSARIDHPTDRDWYRFPGQAGRRYLLEAAGAGSGLALEARLGAWPPNAYFDWVDSSLRIGDTTRIDWLCPADGEYYLQIHAVDSNAAGPYRLSLRSPAASPRHDAYEPDDRVELIPTTAADGAIQDRSFHQGDIDILRFPVDPNLLYAIDIDGPGGAHWDSLEYSPGIPYGDWSWMADSVGHPRGSRFLFASRVGYGHVVLKLSAAKILPDSFWNTPGATASYRIAIRILPDSQNAVLTAHEPDDDLSMAQAIGSDGAGRSGMLFGSDQDWLRFPATAGRSYAIELRGTGGIRTELFEAVHVWNDARAEYDSVFPLSPPVFTSDSVTRITWTSPRTMDAYLRLLALDWTRFVSYTVTVLEIPPATPLPTDTPSEPALFATLPAAGVSPFRSTILPSAP